MLNLFNTISYKFLFLFLAETVTIVRNERGLIMMDNNYIFQLHTHEIVEVCAKILYQVELQRNTLEQMWGFSVEAELIENSDRQDELCCYVSRVEDKSVAMQNGKIIGMHFSTTHINEAQTYASYSNRNHKLCHTSYNCVIVNTLYKLNQSSIYFYSFNIMITYTYKLKFNILFFREKFNKNACSHKTA